MGKEMREVQSMLELISIMGKRICQSQILLLEQSPALLSAEGQKAVEDLKHSLWEYETYLRRKPHDHK